MTKIDEIIEEFQELQGEEKLELLMEFSEELPELPPAYQKKKEMGENRIHECQTPVYLWVEEQDGHIRIHADVAPEAPTVKGFVSILIEAYDQRPAEEALSCPNDLLNKIGLTQVLGMMRMNGLGWVIRRMKTLVAETQAQKS